MATTLSLVPLQALSTSVPNGSQIQMTGPYILVRATTVAQQVQAKRQLKSQEVCKKPEQLRCKRRTDLSGLHQILPKPQPAAVARRNERERNRVKMVNLGFETLREHVPSGKKNKKMSKVETLKAATDYIKYLQDILQGDNENLHGQTDLSSHFASLSSSLTQEVGQLMMNSPGSSPSPSASSSSDGLSESFNSEDEELMDIGSWFS